MESCVGKREKSKGKTMKIITSITVLAACSGLASADFTDFESDPTGAVLNGFISVSAPSIMFSDTMGTDLSIFNGAESNSTNALAAFGDDFSAIHMDFSTNISDLSFDFGNDDGAFHGATVWAWLIGYNGGTAITVGFATNSDDLMNESIALPTGIYDSAEFFYGDASGNMINLIEIIDNVRTTKVPAPSALALLGLGGLVAGRRRR